jgi:hypothetical protein
MKKIEQQNYLLGIHPRRRHDEAAPQRRRKAGSGAERIRPVRQGPKETNWGEGVDCLTGGARWKRGRPDESQATADGVEGAAKRGRFPSLLPLPWQGGGRRAAALCGFDLTGCRAECALGWCFAFYSPTRGKDSFFNFLITFLLLDI